MATAEAGSQAGGMWLNLEVGCARSLRIHDKLLTFDQFAPGPGQRRSLVVEAAHTYFPEAGLESLPHLAEAELRQGLTGPLRAQIAASHPEDPNLATLRDALVTRLGGSADCTGALTLVDHIYLSRVVNGKVAPVITANCVWWYGHWRSANGGPSMRLADAMQQLAGSWLDNPDRRDIIDRRIIAEARAVVGNDPPELADHNV